MNQIVKSQRSAEWWSIAVMSSSAHLSRAAWPPRGCTQLKWKLHNHRLKVSMSSVWWLFFFHPYLKKVYRPEIVQIFSAHALCCILHMQTLLCKSAAERCVCVLCQFLSFSRRTMSPDMQPESLRINLRGKKSKESCNRWPGPLRALISTSWGQSWDKAAVIHLPIPETYNLHQPPQCVDLCFI